MPRPKSPQPPQVRPPGLVPAPASAGGFERLILAMALLLPLGVAVMMLGQLTGTSLAAPSSLSRADASMNVLARRPAVVDSAPPPTLVPPTATPRPTATPVPVAAAPTAGPTAAPLGGTYTVKPGDELKHIAAVYNVSIWKIIAANDIPNPDSLKIGQVLRIPDQ